LHLDAFNATALAGGGLVAGVVNAMAGGGSLLTVPLLVMLGLPGTLANATNRVAVLIQSAVGAWRFSAEGVSGFRDSLAILVPLSLGSATGALLIARVSDATFEKLFGIVMLALLVPALRPPRAAAIVQRRPTWSKAASFAVFLAIGLYGGAFQAGVGIVLVLALARSGFDLVRANSIKMVVVTVFTAVAVVVFVAHGQIVWLPALVLAAGTSLGATIGARLAVRGGERIVRPVLVASVIVLAGRMLGIY
jgi:uncharacterized membrane protein YfcA